MSYGSGYALVRLVKRNTAIILVLYQMKKYCPNSRARREITRINKMRELQILIDGIVLYRYSNPILYCRLMFTLWIICNIPDIVIFDHDKLFMLWYAPEPGLIGYIDITMILCNVIVVWGNMPVNMLPANSSNILFARPRVLRGWHNEACQLSPWTSYQIHKIASCACAWNAENVFPATDFTGNR